MLSEKHFIDWEKNTFGYGYGTGEEYTIKALKEFFGLLKDERTYDHSILENHYGELAAWLLINILCHADILEYGTSSRYGWLTEKGEKLRDFVKTKTEEELYDLTGVEEAWTICYPDICNCGEMFKEGKNPCKNPLF